MVKKAAKSTLLVWKYFRLEEANSVVNTTSLPWEKCFNGALTRWYHVEVETYVRHFVQSHTHTFPGYFLLYFKAK